MRFRVYQADVEVVAQARSVGVYGNTRKRLSRMARQSAPFTSDRGNRRFDDFVLAVQDDRVVWIERIEEHDKAA